MLEGEVARSRLHLDVAEATRRLEVGRRRGAVDPRALRAADPDADLRRPSERDRDRAEPEALVLAELDDDVVAVRLDRRALDRLPRRVVVAQRFEGDGRL